MDEQNRIGPLDERLEEEQPMRTPLVQAGGIQWEVTA
jgi:hypothetical protein